MQSRTGISKRIADDLTRSRKEGAVDKYLNMNLIIDGVWLGDRFAVQNASALAKAGITHILSVTTDSITYPHPKLEIKRVEIDDYPDVDIIERIPETNAFIENAVNGGGCVLVHCTQGVSRSAAIVAAYLMKTQPSIPTVQAAIAHLRSRRRVVCPNTGFARQLSIYEEAGYNVQEDDVGYREWKVQRDDDFKMKLQKLEF